MRRLQQGHTVDLRTIASCIGGSEASRHGIVLAKSQLAKKAGVQTGSPLVDARRACPNLVVVPPDYNLYMKSSNAMVSIFKEYSPKVQQFSIDECFIDYSNMERTFGNPIDVAHEIRNRVFQELGFTVNVGISHNKILAKMASDFEKPNRVHTLWPEEVPDKLWKLPVGDLFMVGRSTKKSLDTLGIHTIGELANADTKMLYSLLKSHGLMVQNYARGIDVSPVKKSNFEIIKSIGNSTTSNFDVERRADAFKIILSLTESVCMRLRSAGFMSQLVMISLVDTQFGGLTHQRKLAYSTDSTDEVFSEAIQLFDEIWAGGKIRKFGVRVGQLHTNDFNQVSIFEDQKISMKRKRVDNAVDEIRGRYGTKSIIRATFLHSGISPISGGVNEGDYPVMTSIL